MRPPRGPGSPHFAFAPAAAGGSKLPVPYNFGAAVAAQSQAPNSPPPGANDWDCKPTRARPNPVVLVHGLAANQTVNWQTMSPLLANNGYCVFALTYGNDPSAPFPRDQFGGLRQSGNGWREAGTQALDVYSDLKTIYINHNPNSV